MSKADERALAKEIDRLNREIFGVKTKEKRKMPTGIPNKKGPRLAGVPIQDSALVKRGRKGLMKAAGIGNGAVRAPLTMQLLDTLKSDDSYVTVPLTGTRTKATTIFNLKTKATKIGAELHWTLSKDEKTVYAWFTKGKTPSKGKTNGREKAHEVPTEIAIQ
jgi:hypothetical protein